MLAIDAETEVTATQFQLRPEAEAEVYFVH